MTEEEKQNVPKIVVGVLILNEKGDIFLARSYKWNNTWVVPGGHLKWGETLEECVKREVKEETNLDVDKIELIGIQESIFSKEYHQKRHMVFLDFSAKVVGGSVKLNDELQEYRWFSPQQSLQENLNSSTRKLIEAFLERKQRQKKFFE
ncbi:MAG TPA: NUDIX domain-containing protein [Candidatus Nanoarchaeia archaeon]|nr:NUDIX domain-containing protein [Candidatus Nanoarchaeia archaeon]